MHTFVKVSKIYKTLTEPSVIVCSIIISLLLFYPARRLISLSPEIVLQTFFRLLKLLIELSGHFVYFPPRKKTACDALKYLSDENPT